MIKLSKAMICLALLAVVAFSSVATAQNVFEVGINQTVKINRHGTCRKVTNTGTTPVMIPTRSVEEWQRGSSAFLQNPHPELLLGPCLPRLSPVNSARLYTPDQSSYTNTKTSGYAIGDYFGSSVWMSPDGSQFAVGEWGWDDIDRPTAQGDAIIRFGRTVFYQKNAGVNYTVSSQVTHSGYLYGVSDDGNRLVTGPNPIRVYRRDGASWVEEFNLPAVTPSVSTSTSPGKYGFAQISPSGDVLFLKHVIDSGGSASFSYRAYARSGNSWSRISFTGQPTPDGIGVQSYKKPTFDRNGHLFISNLDSADGTPPNSTPGYFQTRIEVYDVNNPTGVTSSANIPVGGEVQDFAVSDDGTRIVAVVEDVAPGSFFLKTFNFNGSSWNLKSSLPVLSLDVFDYYEYEKVYDHARVYYSGNGITLSGDGGLIWTLSNDSSGLTLLSDEDGQGTWVKVGRIGPTDYGITAPLDYRDYDQQKARISASSDFTKILVGDHIDNTYQRNTTSRKAGSAILFDQVP